ncbi:hypothetical protein BDP27DRAFT_1321306 [Rhodocollybia butyracea]|uniref:Uncharacterized protein n=1 Tax=Rhodocollybia butyracea TaxID=206335 RepID=A0A9P5Q142_9AGAR|nr:hypothetical protein BDP27DRAFT_1321306 [Rhodocollybia butyracea]
MTPAEQAAQINAFGSNCYFNVVNLVISTITCGIATLGILIAIRLLHIKTWREPKAIQLLCCMFISLAWIGQNILAYIVNFGQIKSGIVKEIPTPPSDLVVINDIQVCLSDITILAGDLVICWRAWVLLPHNRFWRFVLATIAICDAGLSVADIIFDDLVSLGLLDTHIPVLDLVFLVISLVVNMTATLLIGWKAWAHYRTMREVSVWRKSHVQKILLFLVESGAIFLFIQLFALSAAILSSITVENTVTFDLVINTAQEVWFASAAVYPLAIIIIIHSDNSPIAETIHLTAQLPTLSVS